MTCGFSARDSHRAVIRRISSPFLRFVARYAQQQAASVTRIISVRKENCNFIAFHRHDTHDLSAPRSAETLSAFARYTTRQPISAGIGVRAIAITFACKGANVIIEESFPVSAITDMQTSNDSCD